MSSAVPAGSKAGTGDLPKATPKGHSDLKDWQKKAILGVTIAAVVLAGAAIVKKVREPNTPKEEAQSVASKTKKGIKDIFSK